LFSLLLTLYYLFS